MKFAIIIGHNSKQRGMVTYDKKTEFEFNLQVAEKILEQTKIPYVCRLSSMSYEQQVYHLVHDLQKNEITHALELHLNSAENKARGAEILCHYNEIESEKKKAGEFLADYCEISGEHNRRLKNLTEESRGFLLLSSCRRAKITAFIWEPAFCNWENLGSKFVLEQTEKYISTMGQLCQDYFMELPKK